MPWARRRRGGIEPPKKRINEHYSYSPACVVEMLYTKDIGKRPELCKWEYYTNILCMIIYVPAFQCISHRLSNMRVVVQCVLTIWLSR